MNVRLLDQFLDSAKIAIRARKVHRKDGLVRIERARREHRVKERRLLRIHKISDHHPFLLRKKVLGRLLAPLRMHLLSRKRERRPPAATLSAVEGGESLNSLFVSVSLDKPRRELNISSCLCVAN